MNHDDAIEVLEWFATGKTPPSTAALERIGYRGLLQLLSSGLVVAAEVEFESKDTTDHVRNFAKNLEQLFPDAEPPLRAESVEKLLRMALETEDVELDIPTDELVATGMRMIHHIIKSHEFDEPQRRQYYEAVTAMACSKQ